MLVVLYPSTLRQIALKTPSERVPHVFRCKRNQVANTNIQIYSNTQKSKVFQ
jgi:hypothetical protein